MQYSRIGFVLLCLGLMLGLTLATGIVPVHAQDSAESLIEKTDSYYEIQVVKGNLAIKEGNYEDALEFAENVLADKPGHAQALAVKTRALFSLGRGEEALGEYKELEGQDLEDQTWRVGYGIVLRAKGDTAAAKKQFAKAVKSHPDHGAANYNYGVSLFNEKKYAKAAPYFDKAIAAEFSLAAAHYYRGRCAQQAGDTAEAGAQYNQARGAGPSGRLAADLDKAIAGLDAGPGASEPTEAAGLRVSGRLGYSYDSNVLLNPTDLSNQSVGATPILGGSQKDGRIETVLGVNYEASDGDHVFGGGYNFTGFWQLGHGKATTDFTMLSHDLGVFGQRALDDDNAVSLGVNGVLTTLGRIPGADDSSTTGLRHELFNVQLIVDLSAYHSVSDETLAGLFFQYSRDFRPEDNLGTPVATNPLPNGIFDADIFHTGARLIHDIEGMTGQEGNLNGSLALFWRNNETDTAGVAVSDAASFLGPRVRVGVEVGVVENVTLSTDILYAFEYHYDDEALNTSNRADHRFQGIVKGRYDATENVGVSLQYRGELMKSNVSAPDPSYDRHVVTFNLEFQN